MMKQQKTSRRLTVTLRPVLVERHDVPIRFRQFQSTTSCWAASVFRGRLVEQERTFVHNPYGKPIQVHCIYIYLCNYTYIHRYIYIYTYWYKRGSLNLPEVTWTFRNLGMFHWDVGVNFCVSEVPDLTKHRVESVGWWNLPTGSMGMVWKT